MNSDARAVGQGTPAYEFVVAGAGLSGLSLAAELAREFPERRMLVVDPIAARVGERGGGEREGEGDFDRCLGFWCPGTPPFADLVEGSWDRLGVDGPGGPHQLELGPLRYHVLRWARLRDALLDRLRAAPQVELRCGRVTELGSTAEGATVDIEGEGKGEGESEAEGERVQARWVFDSRPRFAGLAAAPGRILAWQRFVGLRIEAAEPRFHPELACFMDLRPSTAQRVAFSNVVPESETRALVYHVEIAARPEGPPLIATLEHDLPALFGVERWRELGREQGALPMSDQPWVRRASPAVLRIGIAGGLLKSSTGYALTRILADNQAILASLTEQGHPFALPRPRARYRWLDGVLLERLLARPEQGPEFFAALYRRCSTATLFDLLDERASWIQLLEVMAAMPHKLQLAGAGVRRLLAWLGAPGVPALPVAPKRS